MKISISGFKGTFPRISDRLLPESAATVAEGVRLQSGEIRSFRIPTLVEALGPGPWSAIYKWRAGGQDYWLRFPGDVNVVRSPVADDVWERIYWTGDARFDEPRMSYTPAAQGLGAGTGSGTGTDNQADYPVVSYKLGIPAPGSQIQVDATDPVTLTVAEVHHERPIRIRTTTPHGLADGELVKFRVTADAPAPGENSLEELLNSNAFQIRLNNEADELLLVNTDAFNVSYSAFVSGEMDQYFDPALMDVRFYVHTYVSEIGEEGPPSAPSAAVRMTPYQTATLSLPLMEVGDGEGRRIVTRRIYRTATGTIGASFQFVAELPVEADTFTDDVPTQNLGEPIPSTEWDPPHVDMIGIDVAAQGHALGFFRNVLAFSEPNMLHAWPTSYQLALDYEIVAAVFIDNGAVVGTTGRPYIVQGIEPRTMLPRRLELNYACMSKQSMVSLGYAAVYASSAGLVMVDRGGARLITDKIITAEEWSAFKPATIHAYETDGKYLGFYDGGAFLFDPREPELGIITLDIEAVAGFSDAGDPYLYLLDSEGNVLRWDDPGAMKQAWRWQSKVFGLPHPANFAAGKVTAKINYGEGINLRLIADGVTVYEHLVTNGEPFWMPGGYLAREIMVDLDGSGDLQMVELAESMEELEP